MSGTRRLLDVLGELSADGPFDCVLATTFNFDGEFFASTGVLPALAGLLDRGADDQGRRKRVDPALARDELGNPYVAVLQGCPPDGSDITSGWIHRWIWPTRSRGLLHAKTLVAAGTKHVHCLVTSANLTERSWCSNLEVAVAWSAPWSASSSDRRRSVAARTLVEGLAKLAASIDAQPMLAAAHELASKLSPIGPGSPEVLWSGGPFAARPLKSLGSGHDSAVVVSPFWPADHNGARQAAGALSSLAGSVTLVGRDNGGRMELPADMQAAAGTHGFRTHSASSNTSPDASDPLNRRLHAKQIAVCDAQVWTSYVGSANATVQGLGLAGRPNIELGVLTPTECLIDHTPAPELVEPPDTPGPEDPAWILDASGAGNNDVAAQLYETDGNYTLEVQITPAPGQRAGLEVPTGDQERRLRHRRVQTLDLDDRTAQRVIQRPEATLVDGGRRSAIPVVLSEELKLRIDSYQGSESWDLDAALASLASNPVAEPTEDDSDTYSEQPQSVTSDLPELETPPVPRKPVHRAREAIEVISAAEEPLRGFLAADPPPRLVALRLGGRGGIVDLARQVEASAETDEGLGGVAGTFVLNEISLLLGRLQSASAQAALQNLRREVDRLYQARRTRLEQSDRRAASDIQKLRAQP